MFTIRKIPMDPEAIRIKCREYLLGMIVWRIRWSNCCPGSTMIPGCPAGALENITICSRAPVRWVRVRGAGSGLARYLPPWNTLVNSLVHKPLNHLVNDRTLELPTERQLE